MFLKHHLLADVTLFVLSVHGLPSALEDSRAVNVFQPVSLRFDRRAFNIFERQYVPSDCSVGVACLSSAACCDSFDSCCGNNCCAPGFQCVNAIVGSGLACCDGNSIVDGSCGASSSGNPCAPGYSLCQNINGCCPLGNICYIDNFGAGRCALPAPTPTPTPLVTTTQPVVTTATPIAISTSSFPDSPVTSTSPSAFISSFSATGTTTAPTTSSATAPAVVVVSSSSHSVFTPAVIGGIAGGGGALLLILIIGIYCCCRPCCCRRPETNTGEDLGDGSWGANHDTYEKFEPDPDPVGEMDEDKVREALIPTFEALEKDQTAFLDSVQAAVHRKIKSSRPGDCAAIREVKNRRVTRVSPTVIKNPLDWADWPKRMWVMSRHDPKDKQPPTYKGATLDSWLTPEILKTVDEQCQGFFNDRAEIIDRGLSAALQRDPYLRRALAKQVADVVQKTARKPVTKKMYKSIRNLVEHSLLPHANHALGVTVGTSAGHTIVANLSVALFKALSHSLAALLHAHLTTKTLEAVAHSAMQHVLGHTVQAGIIAAVIPHFFGVSAHAFGAAVFPAIPIFILAWQIDRFPSHLANKVAPEVRKVIELEFQEPGKSFRTWTESAVMEIARTSFADGCKKVAKGVVWDGIDGVEFVEKTLDEAKKWVTVETTEVLDKEFPNKHGGLGTADRRDSV